MKPYYESRTCKLYLGDCEKILPCIDEAKANSVVTDPPDPEIDRDYGRLTEAEWRSLMDGIIPSIKTLVRPSGSAVFILQPNSEYVGRMRVWLWEFMAKWGRDWNMPQDAWWWNFATPPTVHCHRENGLMRPSIKACVWLGDPDCYRNQSAVLLPIAEATASDKRINRHELGYSPSGLSMRHGRALAACQDRGGSTPFNVVVCANSDSSNGGGCTRSRSGHAPRVGFVVGALFISRRIDHHRSVYGFWNYGHSLPSVWSEIHRH